MRSPAHAVLATALLVLALLVGEGAVERGSAGAATARAGGAQCAQPGRTGRFRVTVNVEGQARSALVNVPPGATGRQRLPLVVALHGAGGNGRSMETYSGLTKAGNQRGFVIAYPDAEGKFWQLAPTGEQANDDVAFIGALIDQLKATVCTNARRVYATGVSNGGGLTARLGCELSDRVAAIAPVAGIYAPLPPCHPDRPVSVLEVHGTNDVAVDYAQVAPFLAQWAALDSCPKRVVRSRVTLRTLLFARPACVQRTAVEHVKILGGPHAWPGTPLDKPGHTLRFAAAPAVLSFFASRRLSAPTAAP